MIDDKDLLKIIKYLFGFGDYREMFCEINKDTGRRESGITIVKTKKVPQSPDNYLVSINWGLLEKIIGD